MAGKPLRRRRVLASIGAGSIVAVPVGGASQQKKTQKQDGQKQNGQKQKRDPTQYDRPRTVEQNGVTYTEWDCSRVIIKSSQQDIYQILVWVMYTGTQQPEGITGMVHGTLDIHAFDLPVDIRVNDHLDEFDPLDGSVIIEGLAVYNSLGERKAPGTLEQGLVAETFWPLDEWECYEVMGMVPPDDIIRPKSAIPYEYNAEPY